MWRYLRASRIYEQLRADLVTRQHILPALASLPAEISAESLELFEKLRRAAPIEVTDPIAVRLVNGGVTREELRTLWQDYRPALKGRTAQGRGVVAPRVDRGDPGVAQSLMEAEVLLALRRSGQDWTGTTAPDVYEVFAHVQLPARSEKPKVRIVDAVVLLRRRLESPIEFHAIEARGDLGVRSIGRWLEYVGPYFDGVWIVVSDTDGRHAASNEYEGVGLLQFKSKGLAVLREAGKMPRAGQLAGELAKALLVRALRES